MALWLVAAASAGELQGEVAVDALHAASTSQEPASGAGPGLSATEVGLRLRGDVVQGPFRFDLDYWGREPVAGLYRTLPIRMVYRAEATFAVVEDTVTVGLGRFVAPAPVLTLVDGGRVRITPGDTWSLELYGGRRGLLVPRTGIGFSPTLPVAGFATGVHRPRGAVDLRGSWGGDVATIGTAEASHTETYTAASAQLLGWVAPADPLRVGATATLAQRATYLLAPPGPEDPFDIALLSADLFQALGWASWRPADGVRLDADVLRQEAQLHAGPTLDADPPGPDFPVVEPTFVDTRLRAALRTFGDRGWLRPDARLRLRPSRTEVRVGGGVELDRFPGFDQADGPFAEAFAWAEDVETSVPGMDDAALLDRLLWSASGGWRTGGFEGRLGASFVERSIGPLSARSLDAQQSVDLAPFVLEAQDLLFLRAFYARRGWFAGTDLEASVRDPEVRVFVQLGLLTERRW
ncbi:MAG: hypothetical protein R3F59_20515 [Myxococcota bacterium]